METFSALARRPPYGLVAASLSIWLFGVSALAADAPPEDDTVTLPKLTVAETRDLPPPEIWKYAEIPGFEILTNASDRATRRLIRDFQIFQEALAIVFPVPIRTGTPTSLILCGRGGNFDAFLPSGDVDPSRGTASLFYSNAERSAIVVDVESSTLNLASLESDDSTTGTKSNEIQIDHNKLLYREYVHFLLSRSNPRPPAWMEEGFAQLIMAMKFTKTSIIFGKLEDPNSVSFAAATVAAANAAGLANDPGSPVSPDALAEDRDFNDALKQRQLLPLDRLFGVGRDAPEVLNPLGNNIWAKECYAFVHMCLYGRGQRYSKPFVRFVSRLSSQPPSEALFQECYAMTYSQMLSELKGYIDFTDYKSFEFRGKNGAKLAEPAPLAMREAGDAEVGRVKGEAMELAGHLDGARLMFLAPYVRGERDPRLLAALGLCEIATHHADRGRKFLEAAAAGKVQRGRAYVELARLRLAEAIAKPAGAGGKLAGAQTVAVLEPLFTSRSQPPPMPEMYELIADTWAHSANPPTRDNLGVLTEGVRLYPRDAELVYRAAALNIEAGFGDDAGQLVQLGLKVAPDAAMRARFDELQARLRAGVVKMPAPK